MRILSYVILVLLLCNGLSAQQNSLVNTSNSEYAKLKSVGLTDVKWTEGFWNDWFGVCKNSMVPHMMNNYMDEEISHAFTNFEIAAGLKDGEHVGPPFHDGDFYKMLEGLITVYSVTKEKELELQIDSIIEVIGNTQRKDGYIHTPVVIKQGKDNAKEFAERLDFETYNMGHLMTAACLHYRITGKKDFLNIAIKATDFLYGYYKRSADELAKNAICPSHYMGVTEMYRTTKDPKYLELAKGLIEIRSLVTEGTDHNQDRIPFKKQTKAEGHAVRANYLYAGAADVYNETGDDSLYQALNAIWHDLVERKLYITGACGALYDGVSPNGTSYTPSEIQQVHQAYGQDYELPNLSAHNESCANIGNMLWNWRMFLATGEERFLEVMELTMYNSLLAGVSMDGKGYFYTNPLSFSNDVTYELRWSKQREEYISYCNCCPPNTIRTIAQIHNYMYSITEKGLWVNFYGGNHLHTKLENGNEIKINQKTDYPWSGDVLLSVEKAPKGQFDIHLRIPQWAKNAKIFVNNTEVEQLSVSGTFCSLNRKWKKGDVIKLELPMETMLIEANPLVEETRNQIAVKRGPVVYCLESIDIEDSMKLSDVVIPISTDFIISPINIQGQNVVSLSADVELTVAGSWQNTLYRPVKPVSKEKINISLVPYYAWGNRGLADMSVWLPVSK